MQQQVSKTQMETDMKYKRISRLRDPHDKPRLFYEAFRDKITSKATYQQLNALSNEFWDEFENDARQRLDSEDETPQTTSENKTKSRANADTMKILQSILKEQQSRTEELSEKLHLMKAELNSEMVSAENIVTKLESVARNPLSALNESWIQLFA